jgi:hypothetical protein
MKEVGEWGVGSREWGVEKGNSEYAPQLLWDGHLARPDPKGKIPALQTNQQINLQSSSYRYINSPTPHSPLSTPHSSRWINPNASIRLFPKAGRL